MSTYSLRMSSSFPMIEPGPAAISRALPPGPSPTNLRWRSGGAGVGVAEGSCRATAAPQKAAARRTPMAILGAAGMRSGDRDAGVSDDRAVIPGRLSRMGIGHETRLAGSDAARRLQSRDRGSDPAHADVLLQDDAVQSLGIEGQDTLDRLMILPRSHGRRHIVGHVAADDQQDVFARPLDRGRKPPPEVEEGFEMVGPDAHRHERDVPHQVLQEWQMDLERMLASMRRPVDTHLTAALEDTPRQG